MKTIKILFCLLILVSLVSCGPRNASDTHRNFSFHQISSPLKVVPDDFKSPRNGYYRLIETTNGKEEKLFSKFYIADSQHSSPIYRKSENSYLLIYASQDLRIEYKLGAKEVSDAQTGGPLNEPGDGPSYPPYVMKEPAKNLSMLSVSYNSDLKIGYYIYLCVSDNYVPGDNGGAIYIDSTPNNISCDIDFSSYIYASLKNGIVSVLNNALQVKEKYSRLSASFNGEYLYSDHINNNLKPDIYRVSKLENDGGTLFKSSARHPVVSDDDTIFTYSYSDKASFDDNCKWQTIIEKNGKQVKKFNTEQIILMDDKNKTIYAINPASDVVQKIGMTTFQVIATGSIDKGFIFPQIYNSKLQYTCPVYKNGKIVNYVVKEED